MRTFVTVGNATQPFDRLLRAVKTITPRLPRPVLVQRGVSTVTHPDWEIHAFLPMDRFEREVAAARVLIMHAGAGSAIHALRTGRKPILMPRRASRGEHVDDHQVEFADALAAAGLVFIARDENDLEPAVEAALASASAPASAHVPRLVSDVAAILAALAGRSSDERHS